MRHRVLVFSVVFLIVGSIFGANKAFSQEPSCPTPLMHLPDAGVKVCIQPIISRVLLTFDRQVKVSAFADVVERVPGIDIDNSLVKDDRKSVALAYYMSETSVGKFLGEVLSLIDDSRLFD